MGRSKKKKSARSAAKEETDDGMIRDERFQIAQTHPQFQKLHTKKNNDGASSGGDGGLLLSSSGKETEVDERFKAILTDSRFAIGGDIGVAEGGVDKYGRKLKKKKRKDQKINKREELDEGRDDGNDTSDTEQSDQEQTKSDEDSDGEDNDVVPDDPESRIAYLTALSRGEIDVSSSSEEETSDDEEDDDDGSSDDDSTGSEDSIRGRAGVLDPSTKDETLMGEGGSEVELTFDDSRFLAICNVDWENMRAVDLLAIVSSFSPPGSVKCVKVYPSDFGMERMERDRTLGPVGIWKKKKHDDESDGDGDDDSDGESEDNAGLEGGDDDDHTEDDDVRSDDGSVDEEALKETYKHFNSNTNDEQLETDFDPEKLRAYEASKLKYYFAVTEFTTPMAADQVYKELDGLEIGSSSTAVDLRAIPDDAVDDAIKGRKVRDEASTIPSNYTSPDFVVNALQKTEVQCTWEEGDKERERLLTQYGVGNNAWAAMTEGDDLKAYLASDVSSDEESDDDDDAKGQKVSNMRKLLGLGDSDGDDDKDDFLQEDSEADDDDSFFGGGKLADSEGSDDEGGAQQMTYIPGKSSLKEKIRTKLKEKEEGVKELTPWEKYQLKRKEKRKEKKRAKKQQKAAFKGENNSDSEDVAPKDKKVQKKANSSRVEKDNARVTSSKEELDLLLAGDNDEEAEKDFHMRDLVRIEKNKSKKLRGSRKRKEDDIAANASGLDFKIDTKDSRFAAVLDGTDDRFGIDRTDPQYKETAAMRELLVEQTKRRKSKKRRKTQKSTDVNADSMNSGADSGGALALSSLVKSLKSKVAK